MAKNGGDADEGNKSHCFLGNQVLFCHNDAFKSILVLKGLMQKKQCKDTPSISKKV